MTSYYTTEAEAFHPPSSRPQQNKRIPNVRTYLFLAKILEELVSKTLTITMDAVIIKYPLLPHSLIWFLDNLLKKRHTNSK